MRITSERHTYIAEHGGTEADAILEMSIDLQIMSIYLLKKGVTSDLSSKFKNMLVYQMPLHKYVRRIVELKVEEKKAPEWIKAQFDFERFADYRPS